MLEQQRHRLILDMLNETSCVTVRELTETLNASKATIRRDLMKLAAEAKLHRLHGGAESIPGTHKSQRHFLRGSSFLADKERHVMEKRAIAEQAVTLCEEGDSIIINGGSSTYMMAEFLIHREMDILTNSIPLSMELLENSSNRVSVPGGELFRKQEIIVSPFEHDIVSNYHASKMFMSIAGIGEYGLMESDSLLVRAIQKLLKQADQLIVLADSSKLGKRSNLILCGLERVDTVITDEHADENYLKLLEASGIEVIVVSAQTQKNKGAR